MERVLNLAGKNSGEVYQLRYPQSLLNFCDFDLSYFAENAIAICDEALRTGEADIDRVTELRSSLRRMHVYIEHNLRTVYDKIVLDCWIDYVCRRDSTGTAALWNRFMDCRTPFEKSVFVRLCEYRYNKGINEWLNLVRVQDYAKSKVYFLFSRGVSGIEEANARRNYFDLMFSVTAQELGCRLESMGVVQVCSAGRLPSSPFMYPNISKDIIRNALADFDYTDDYSDITSYDSLSDEIAMDAFARMKQALAQEMDSQNMQRDVLEAAPMRVYMPIGLKAAVDLEIDALLESGGWLSRCKRCGRYYVMDADNMEEYCQLPSPNGKTCLDIYYEEHPQEKLTPDMVKRCDAITNEMFGRISDGKMTLKEYESWKHYLDAMKEKVINGEIQTEDLSAFIDYSHSMDITKSNPVSEVKHIPQPEVERVGDRVIKPFIPERINRSDLEASKKLKPAPAPAEEIPTPAPQQAVPARTSAPVQGKPPAQPVLSERPPQRQPMSHIIRGGEVRGTGQQISETGFTTFTGNEFRAVPNEIKPAVSKEKSADVRKNPADSKALTENAPAPSARSFTPFNSAQEVKPASIFKPKKSENPDNTKPERSNSAESQPQQSSEKQLVMPSGEPASVEISSESKSSAVPQQEIPAEPSAVKAAEKSAETEAAEKPDTSAQTAERPRTIRKNAAAISAYGKIAGSAPRTDGSFEAVSRPEEQPEVSIKPENAKPDYAEKTAAQSKIENPDKMPNKQAEEKDDPFWNAGAVFDILQQSENQDKKPQYIEPKQEKSAPVKSEQEAPREEAPHEVPKGIWTEERDLYGQENDTHEEIAMLREKKRTKSNKTQRLFDAIMRESDDNPNFRKK